MTLSVVIITFNEAANLGRTLPSVKPVADEIIVVDSGSTDRTREIAASFGAKVFLEDWKGYAAQKNSAIAKAVSDWVLSLDADEEVSRELAGEIVLRIGKADAPERASMEDVNGYWTSRRNHFLGRWIRHGGFWPDRKLRLVRRGFARFVDRPVHEVMEVNGPTATLQGALIHHAYPTLTGYINQMNRYSTLGAEVAVGQGQTGFSVINIVLRPLATFFYNYFFRLGFLDGREGLLLHLYHAAYVSWKYAKAWEIARAKPAGN